MELDWAAKWDRLANTWGALEPPAIPSIEDTRNFVKLAKARRQAVRSVVVLGSTPALRLSMSQMTGVETLYCIDISQSAFKTLSTDLIVSNESFVHADWLSMSDHLRPSSVDAIVGDKAIDNLPKSRWPAFFGECRTVLSPGGLLILHVGFPDNTVAHLRPEDIVRSHHSSIGFTVTRKQAASALWEDLLSHSAQYSSDYLTLAPYESLPQTASLSAEELTFFELMVKDHVVSWNNKWTNFDELFLLESAASAGFSLSGREVSRDYHGSANQPILCLEIT